MGHLVAGDHLANLEERERAAARIDDGALPLVLAPPVKKIDSPPAHAREVLDGLLQRPVQVMVVGRVDRGAHVRRGQSVQVGVPEQSVDLGPRIEQVPDQAAESREGGSMAITELSLVEAENEGAY